MSERQVVRVLQEIYGDAASDIKSAPTTGHMGPGGQLSEAVLRDYHSYGHAAAGRLAIARSLAEAMSRKGEGVKSFYVKDLRLASARATYRML